MASRIMLIASVPPVEAPIAIDLVRGVQSLRLADSAGAE